MDRILKNFWVPPCDGFNKSSQGLTEKELQKNEAEIGFCFPVLFRELMKRQNGGYLRRQHLVGQDHYLIEDIKSLPSDNSSDKIPNFLDDYLNTTKDEDEVQELRDKFEYCDPTRLIIFSYPGGHAAACFDYGWLQKDTLSEPQVTIIDQDGSDFLDYREIIRFDNFKVFLEHLKMNEEEEKSYLGIQSGLNFDDFMQAYLKINHQFPLSVCKDNRCGWFNFEKFYSGLIPLTIDNEYISKLEEGQQEMVRGWVEVSGKETKAFAIFSPNRHLSGTSLFPDSEKANIILEVRKSIFELDILIHKFCCFLKTQKSLYIKTVETLP